MLLEEEDVLHFITTFIVPLVLMQLTHIYSIGNINLTMKVFKLKHFDCFLDENNPKSWLKIIDFAAETQIFHWCI